MMKTSPESSRSSSRNSSVSPRERPSSSMKNRNGANAEISPSNQAKKQPKKTNSKPLIPWCKRNIGPPKNCNGWSWVGEGSEQKVYLNVSLKFQSPIFPIFEFSRHFQNEEAPVARICYASMKHVEGDVVSPRDCILLASGNRKKDLPFVAKVTALWESPDDGKSFSKKIEYI